MQQMQTPFWMQRCRLPDEGVESPGREIREMLKNHDETAGRMEGLSEICRNRIPLY